mmetsp:Transcript_12503/g.31764  ORF Transcript_12503/g.31764 Transcript_12503/m.31764 type:complete len:311 (+) Transcript_12503:396-1328(+)
MVGTSDSARGETEKIKELAPLWSTQQLDRFIKEVHGLPDGLRAELDKIGEIDARVESKRKDLKHRVQKILSECGTSEKASTTSNQKRADPPQASGAADASDVDALLGEYDAVVSDCDAKVQLALGTYDLVDTHTCRLDHALKSLEEELRSQRMIASLYENQANNNGGNDGKKKKKKKKQQGGDSTVIDTRRELALLGAGAKKIQKKLKKEGKPFHNISKAPANQGSHKQNAALGQQNPLGGAPVIEQQVMDMMVDPNEPTYCYCNRVSFGQMVACDADDCAWEWFHIECVGIQPHLMPKGKWLCPECRKK